MELREIAFIADDLYNRTVESKRNGEWTKNDLKTEAAMYKELKKLGFDFYWHMQLSPAQFTAKDTGIIPIFTKYYGKFDNEGLNNTVMYSLGVPGLYGATQFFLDEYWKHIESREYEKLYFKYNHIGNALYRIKDPHKVKEYMEIINDNDHLDNEAMWFVIELLGRLKAKEAIPRLIELAKGLECYESPKFPPSVIISAVAALGNYRDAKHIPIVSRYFGLKQESDLPYALWLEEEAAKAVKKMGGQVEKVKAHGKIVGWRMITQ